MSDPTMRLEPTPRTEPAAPRLTAQDAPAHHPVVTLPNGFLHPFHRHPARHAPGRTSRIVAGAVGNMLEWYDFAAYGYFSLIIGRNFFPSSSAAASLLAAFAVFAAAFFMRPVGGLLFGYIGDRYGRKAALVSSAALMTLSTCAIGCLPSYASAGLLAPVLLVLLRLGQGLSVGGEYTSSAIFLAEGAAPAQRGLVGSLACVGASGGIMLGSIVGIVVTSLLTREEVNAWGWRIPFLIGIALGAVILLLRRQIEEAEPQAAAEQAAAPSPSPLRAALETDGLAMMRAFAMNLALSVAFYVVFVYLVTYMHTEAGLTEHAAFVINTISMAVLTIAVPVMGALSDRIGHKTVLTATGTGLALLAWPLFALIASGRPELILAAQIVFAVLVAGYSAVIPTALVEMMHSRSRCTALAVSYNAAMALVGGTAPMVATWLVHDLQVRTAPGLYIAALSAISVLADLTMRDRTGQVLD